MTSYICLLRVGAPWDQIDVPLNIYTVFPQKVTAATICFSATTMQRLFEGGAYSRAVLLPLCVHTCNLCTYYSTFTHQFLADAMSDCEEFVFVCSSRSCVQVYLVACHRRAATNRKIRGMALQRDLTHAHCNICYKYMHMWLLFEGGYYFH